MSNEQLNNGQVKNIWEKYGIPTTLAVAVNLIMNKGPAYLRRIGEERERRRLEMEEASEKKRIAYTADLVKEIVRNEIEKYKGEGK